MPRFLSLGPIFGYILWWFFGITKNYGFAIILFTLAIKLILFPISVNQQKSMSGSAKFMEKQKELRKQYKNDPQKVNEELAKLSQTEGANMLSGCLTPLISILSMFFLFAIYSVIRSPLTNILHIVPEKVVNSTQIVKNLPDFQNINEGYREIEILRAFPEHQQQFTAFTSEETQNILNLNRGFNLFGIDLLTTPKGSTFSSLLWLIPFLCFVVQVFTTYFFQKIQGSQLIPGNQGCSKVFIYGLPLFLVWISINVPAAVGIYWIVSGIMDFFQKIVIMKFYNVNILNAKKEAARVERRILEEAQITNKSAT